MCQQTSCFLSAVAKKLLPKGKMYKGDVLEKLCLRSDFFFFLFSGGGGLFSSDRLPVWPLTTSPLSLKSLTEDANSLSLTGTHCQKQCNQVGYNIDKSWGKTLPYCKCSQL